MTGNKNWTGNIGPTTPEGRLKPEAAITQFRLEHWRPVAEILNGRMAGPMAALEKPLDKAMLQAIDSLPDTWTWQEELAFNAVEKNKGFPISVKHERQQIETGLAEGKEYHLLMHTPAIFRALAEARESLVTLGKLKWKDQGTPNPSATMTLKAAEAIVRATPLDVIDGTELKLVPVAENAKLYIDKKGFDTMAAEHAVAPLSVRQSRGPAEGTSKRQLN